MITSGYRKVLEQSVNASAEQGLQKYSVCSAQYFPNAKDLNKPPNTRKSKPKPKIKKQTPPKPKLNTRTQLNTFSKGQRV